jgi:hypothetical protein
VAISDLLIFSGAPPERPTLDDVLPRAMTVFSTTQRAGLSVYWET